MRKAYLIGAVIALSATFVDQITKYLAVKYIAEEVYQEGIFSLQLGSNSGIAFGLNVPAFITVVISIIFMFLGVYLAKNHLDITKKSAVLLTGLVLGGALGNLIDRICTGKVVDFIGISIWPLFNFADMCITVGIFSIVIFYDKLKKTNK